MDSMVVSLQNVSNMEHSSYLMALKNIDEQKKISMHFMECLKVEKRKRIKSGICVGVGSALFGALMGMLLIK